MLVIRELQHCGYLVTAYENNSEMEQGNLSEDLSTNPTQLSVSSTKYAKKLLKFYLSRSNLHFHFGLRFENKFYYYFC